MLSLLYQFLEKIDFALSWWERISKLAYVQWGVATVTTLIFNWWAGYTEQPAIVHVTTMLGGAAFVTYLFTHLPYLLQKVRRYFSADPTSPTFTIEYLQHEALASYFNEGRTLLKECEASLDVPARPAKRWAQKVARYLDSNLGSVYSVHFEDNDDEPKHESGIRESILALKGVSKKNRKIHRYLSTRLYQLSEIMEELRGRSGN